MDIFFRKANQDDCDLLYRWANDDVVRANSFRQDKIKYEDHVNWFRNKMASKDSIIYICSVENKPVAQVRIDIDGNEGCINYSVAETYRGRGIGTIILAKLPEIISRDKINVNNLIGKVKYSNMPSIKAFRSALYEEKAEEGYIEFHRGLN